MRDCGAVRLLLFDCAGKAGRDAAFAGMTAVGRLLPRLQNRTYLMQALLTEGRQPATFR